MEWGENKVCRMSGHFESNGKYRSNELLFNLLGLTQNN